MKSELELQLTESIRLFEAITGKTIRQLRWSSDLRVVTVAVGSPAARVVEGPRFELGDGD